MNSTQDPLYVEDELPVRDEIAQGAGVESITGRTSPVLNGVPSSSSFKAYRLVYDQSGHRITHEKFDQSGKLIRDWRYDGFGGLLREITYDKSGGLDYWLEVVYDGQHWKEKRMYSGQDRLSYRIVAQRNAGGRLLQAIYQGPEGDTIRLDSFEYDSSGVLIRVGMEHMGERLYQYDARGNLGRKVVIQPGASAYGEVYEFQYDSRDLIVRMDYLHFSVTLFEFTFH